MLSQSGRLKKRRLRGARSLLKATQRAGCDCSVLLPPEAPHEQERDTGRVWGGGITGSILRCFGRQWHSLMGVMGSRDSVAGAVPGSPTPPALLFLHSWHKPDGLTSQAARDMPLCGRQLQALPVTLGKVKAAWTPS